MKNLFEAVDSIFEQDNIILDEEAAINSRIEALKDKIKEHRALNEAKKLEVKIGKEDLKKEQSKNN